jgi:hypothetical protein
MVWRDFLAKVTQPALGDFESIRGVKTGTTLVLDQYRTTLPVDSNIFRNCGIGDNTGLYVSFDCSLNGFVAADQHAVEGIVSGAIPKGFTWLTCGSIRRWISSDERTSIEVDVPEKADFSGTANALEIDVRRYSGPPGNSYHDARAICDVKPI